MAGTLPSIPHGMPPAAAGCGAAATPGRGGGQQQQQEQQLSLLSETIANLVALLESVSSGAEQQQARLGAAGSRAPEVQQCLSEARLEGIERQQVQLRSDVGQLEATLCQLKQDVSGILPTLGKQVRDLEDFRGLEGRLGHQYAESQEETRRSVADFARVLKSEATESQARLARQVGALEEEVKACRHQMEDALVRIPELLAVESSLRSRVDDAVATTSAQVESLLSGTSLKAHQHLSREAHRVETELSELARSLRSTSQQAREQLAEEYRADIGNAVSQMVGQLDFELSSSCKELKLTVGMWRRCVAGIVETWEHHSRQDPVYSPQVARDVASSFAEASKTLRQQLLQLRPRQPQLVHPRGCRPWRPVGP